MANTSLKLTLLITSLLIFTIPTSQAHLTEKHAHEHKVYKHEPSNVHEHGKAQLKIAVTGQQIEAVFKSPLINLVGFEHAPKNTQERDRLKLAKEPLEQGLPLLSFNADAQCKITHTEITSTLFLDANYNPINTTANKSQNKHNDLEVTWNYECDEPTKLINANIKLLSTFGEHLKSLEVEWLSAKGLFTQLFTKDETIQF